jgi:hypothetical protein
MGEFPLPCLIILIIPKAIEDPYARGKIDPP